MREDINYVITVDQPVEYYVVQYDGTKKSKKNTQKIKKSSTRR